jgi:transposase-like protein
VPQTKPPYPLEFREHALALLAVSARARAVREAAKGAAEGVAGAGGRAGEGAGGAGAGGAGGGGAAEGRPAAQPLAQIARELGVSAQTLHAWRRRAEVEKRQAEVDAGTREGLWDREWDGVADGVTDGVRGVAGVADGAADGARDGVRDGAADGVRGLTSKEREELRALRKENLSLRNEREILLKAGVFFAQETGK